VRTTHPVVWLMAALVAVPVLVVGYVFWGWMLFGLLVTAPLWVPAVVLGVVWVRRERARQRAVDAALDTLEQRPERDGLDRLA